MKWRRADIALVIAAFLLLVIAPVFRYWPLRHCEAHRDRLLRGMVPIRYGLIERSAKPHWLFPNSQNWRAGGCVMSPLSPGFTVARYCARCREAEAAWNRKHPNGLPPHEWSAVRRQWTQWRKQHPPPM